MKNKDGIEIKAGQKYLNVKMEWEVLFIDDDDRDKPLALCKNHNGIWHILSEESLIFHTLISDPDMPWLPLPEGYRLVTDEEKAGNKKPDAAICWEDISSTKSWSKVFSGGDWGEGVIYVVPTSHTFEQPKPKYKLFEIEWTVDGPMINDPNSPSLPVQAMGCHLVGCYRIFGFTDKDSWKSGDFSEKSPCNHTTNRKYAIGRLEE